MVPKLFVDETRSNNNNNNIKIIKFNACIFAMACCEKNTIHE